MALTNAVEIVVMGNWAPGQVPTLRYAASPLDEGDYEPDYIELLPLSKIKYLSGPRGNGASINLASSSGGVGELIFLATTPIPANQLSETGLPFLFFERVDSGMS